MKIGFAGPVDTRVLAQTQSLPETTFPEAYGLPVNALLIAALLQKGHEVVVFGLSDQIDEPMQWNFGALKVYLGRYRKSGRAKDFF